MSIALLIYAGIALFCSGAFAAFYAYRYAGQVRATVQARGPTRTPPRV